MTLLSALQSASIRLMGRRPTAFASSTNKFELELMDLANEVATDIMKSHEWQVLKRIQEINGDGAAVAFSLPSDFDRFLIDTDMMGRDDRWGQWFTKCDDINEFTSRSNDEWETSWPGLWTVYGNQIRFVPAPEDQRILSFPYITRNFARGQNGSERSEFTNDNDEFLLSDRLLTLGLVWRWRENKKLDYTGDFETFQKAFGEESAKDGGNAIYRSGNQRLEYWW